MDTLVEYKKSVQKQLESNELLVAKLVHENTLLTQQLEGKTQQLELLQDELKKLKETRVSLQKELDTHQDEVEVLRDLFEHLCGVRVHKSYEDDTGLWFDASQGTRSGIMDYKLGFVKGEAEETEVVYVPLLKQRSAQELTVLQQQLPSYLFDTLSFPLKSLNQFYNKVAKCLNKKSK
ncbi:similar to Saccharomyces cerevisiae YCR086W CSM1 Nucleolar protein that forms a complex with Lrs4p and then Mam1p at kinetochores during meiosis I to mediate accurate homolog segregation [Maudiozyma saulgeensis]|uniref:Similar to Saccharomyces cerevisiae YCR086W CSM1 Nucleolar protein that forms a complex with Lrs4p and then Mam1p at kinetochores during meiosis I to mediate accurate homolog segregation n=1 Tax=Maudiozyma saulgeensis TaxID=1789683 RepID=A0A1X7R5E9_9SACH|nr:similar to Saccharomyces cerevisiae YCR086W CSM1 Nucleolar protein that forms a complex with Lrs4p and then Mam1p at kinetochores during meiosis I to mediate accurate homolog segregation [Kazachstania saulgeensis]